MNIDKKNQDKSLLLVWVMNPAGAERILSGAADLASREGLGLMTVSVQKQTRDNWADTLADLEKLDRAARQVNSELHIVYADDAAEAALRLVRELGPKGMFVGAPGGGAGTGFTDLLQKNCPGIPLYFVDADGSVRVEG